MPDRFLIVAGVSVGFLVAAFFLIGGHHELAARLKARRHGGYIL
jgi:hypothetical protein